MEIFKRNNKIVSGKLHDEQVMLDIEKGKYFSLNPIATRIWELLSDPKELEEICRELTGIYDVSLKQCKKETQEYLDEMVKLGLIIKQD